MKRLEVEEFGEVDVWALAKAARAIVPHRIKTLRINNLRKGDMPEPP
jgi:hypothetical protein